MNKETPLSSKKRSPKFNGKFYDWEWFFYKRLGFRVSEDKEGTDAIEGCVREIQEDRDKQWKEAVSRLKASIKQGVKRNKVLPLDWCFYRIDEIMGEFE